MAKKTSKTCGTCRHGKFQRTPTGRTKRDTAGRCLHPAIDSAASIDALWWRLRYSVPLGVFVELPRVKAIWPDYTNCNFWEARDEQST